MTSIFSEALLLAGAMSLSAFTLASAAPAAAPAAPEARIDKRVVVVRDGDGPRRDWKGRRGAERRGHPDPARHAQHLRDVLQLTSAQEPALQAYLAATRPAERPAPPAPRAEGGKAERQRLTTPERLDRQAAMMARRQAAFEARSGAIRTFYGQLTAPQKKAFDALPMMHGPRMFQGPGGGERRTRIMRGETGPDGAVQWFTEDDVGEGSILLGELGDTMDLEFIPAPHPDR